MLMVGLTGGIGAGKSVATAWLGELGGVVIDSDVLAREVVAPGTEGLAAVVAEFGSGVRGPDGSLDRPALGRAVFGDDAARRRLEQIIHPRVRQRAAELAGAAAADAIVVNDVPLLVEAGLSASYHLVIVVAASEAVRLARLLGSRELTEADVRARMRAQATDAQRAAAADVVLPNDGSLAELRERISTLWTDRLLPYERNLRRGTPVWDTYAHLVPYDPTWPAQYARIAARVARAAGPAAVRVDHLGSTAVPGLAAKDTIDIQLSVPDLDTADRIAGALAAAGLPRAPGEWADYPRAEPGAAPWPKRLHGAADPGRSVNLHVRAAGSPGWRYALLMRDFLRADASARAEYAELNRRLASGTPTRAQYADAKNPFFDALVPRMAEWARRTGWTP